MAHTREDELASLLRGQGAIMQEIYSLLEQEEKKDLLVRAAIAASNRAVPNDLEAPDPVRCFDLETIRRTCIKYRLRFLPAGYFKGPLPSQAIIAVRQLERSMGKPLHGFMILAPAQRFRLCDCDADPLLFIPLADGTYYLLHRWGRDLHPLRAVAAWPFRSWVHLVASVALITALTASLIPTHWISADPTADWWGGYRFGAFFCLAMLAGAATSLCWFSFFGQFSKEAWRSKTFN